MNEKKCRNYGGEGCDGGEYRPSVYNVPYRPGNALLLDIREPAGIEFLVEVGSDIIQVEVYRGTTHILYNEIDNMTVLELGDDVARANWGGSWRMPSDSEFQELLDKCTWGKIKMDEIEGYKVTSEVNGNSIFLPVAGWKTSINLLGEGISGNYNSRTVNDSDSIDNLGLYFTSDERRIYNFFSRSDGHLVRPVFSLKESVISQIGGLLAITAVAALKVLTRND